MVYVADRENQRIQVFDPDGNFVSQWKDLAKTSCIAIVSQGGAELAYVGEMYAGLPDNPMGWGNWVAKRLGPRVSVLDLQGNIVARVGDAKPVNVFLAIVLSPPVSTEFPNDAMVM